MWRVVASVLLVGGFSVIMNMSVGMHFTETMARVTGTEEVCYLVKTSARGVIEDIDRSTNGSCRVARLAVTKPKYRDYQIGTRVMVDYRYVSPVDGKTYHGRHAQSAHEDGRPIRRGDELAILAHKKNPKATMPTVEF